MTSVERRPAKGRGRLGSSLRKAGGGNVVRETTAGRSCCSESWMCTMKNTKTRLVISERDRTVSTRRDGSETPNSFHYGESFRYLTQKPRYSGRFYALSEDFKRISLTRGLVDVFQWRFHTDTTPNKKQNKIQLTQNSCWTHDESSSSRCSGT